MDKVTLDTNVLFEYFQKGSKLEVVERLLELADNGTIELAITRRVTEDIPNPPLSNRLSELPNLNISATGSVTRLDHWQLGVDMLGDQAFVDFELWVKE